MLRITSKNSFIFHSTETPFNRDFLKGLFWACLIHGALIFSIRLVLPPNLDRIKPLNPIEVEIDLGSLENDHQTLVQAECITWYTLPLSEKEFFFDLPCLKTHPSNIPHLHFTIKKPDFKELEWVKYELLEPFIEESCD